MHPLRRLHELRGRPRRVSVGYRDRLFQAKARRLPATSLGSRGTRDSLLPRCSLGRALRRITGTTLSRERTASLSIEGNEKRSLELQG
jgi:hypothetical protein